MMRYIERDANGLITGHSAFPTRENQETLPDNDPELQAYAERQARLDSGQLPDEPDWAFERRKRYKAEADPLMPEALYDLAKGKPEKHAAWLAIVDQIKTEIPKP